MNESESIELLTDQGEFSSSVGGHHPINPFHSYSCQQQQVAWLACLLLAGCAGLGYSAAVGDKSIDRCAVLLLWVQMGWDGWWG